MSSGSVGLELHHELLEPFGDLERARRHDLDPFGLRRDDLDRQRARRRRGEDVLHDLDHRGRRDRFLQVPERLPPHRVQQRLRRVVGRHHDDQAAAPEVRAARDEHFEPAHAGQTDIEQHQIDGLRVQERKRGGTVSGLDDGKALGFEQPRHSQAQHAVVVHNQNTRRFGGADGGRFQELGSSHRRSIGWSRRQWSNATARPAIRRRP